MHIKRLESLAMGTLGRQRSSGIGKISGQRSVSDETSSDEEPSQNSKPKEENKSDDSGYRSDVNESPQRNNENNEQEDVIDTEMKPIMEEPLSTGSQRKS